MLKVSDYLWEFRFGLPFCRSSDSVPSDTITDIDSDPLSTIDALTSLYAPVRSSLMVHEMTSEVQGAFFEVPTKHKS